MNFHRSFEQNRNKERKELELRPQTQHPNAETLLAEIKRLLDEDSKLAVASGSVAPAPSPTLPELRQSQQQPDIPGVSIGAVNATPDGEALTPELRDFVGQHPNLDDNELRLRSRRWKLLASGLALAAVAAVGAGYALKSQVPGSLTNSASVVATHEPTKAEPQGADTVAPPAAGDALMKHIPPPAHLQAGDSAKEASATSGSTPTGSPAVDSAQAPEDQDSHAPAGTTLKGSAAESQPGAAAPAVSQPARQEPTHGVAATPDESPSAAGSLSTSPAGGSKFEGLAVPTAAPNPHTEPASAADVSAESARPPAPNNASSTKPPAGKKADHKSVAKKAAPTAARAVASRQRVQRATPKPATTEQAAADPAAAAPTAPSAAPAASADQPAGGLPGAFGYLIHLPGSLVQRVINPNADAK